MPTQGNSGELLSGSETRKENQSDTLAVKAQASGEQSLSDTSGNMTKGEALAIAWTGIEALAHMKQARIYMSNKEANIVWVKFLATEITANGLEAK